MGSLRFCLAFLVLLSHTFTAWPYYFNPGMFALPSFYIISGYAMTAVIRGHYPTNPLIKWFYLDRLLRLYPQYFLFIAVSVFLIFVLNIRDPFFGNVDTDSAKIPFFDISLNLLMIPNNFLLFRSHFGDLALIIPPSWSLGLEMIFYLIFPWILLNGFRIAAFSFSILVFCLAMFNVINPMTWGYTLLPGTLFFFLMGSFLFDLPEKKSKWIPVNAFIGGSIILTFLFFTDGYKIAANIEMLSALVVGPALVYLVKNFRHPVDDFMGNISYGLFLGHFIIIRTILHFSPEMNPFFLFLLVSFLSVLVAIMGYQFVEKPVVIFRRKFRKY